MQPLFSRIRNGVLILLLQTGCALADAEETPDLTGDIWPSLFKLVGSLVFILVIIYGSVWLMKRFSLGKMSRGGELISVVDKRFLAPKQALYLVKVGEKHLLVGSSEAGLTRLADVEPPAATDKPNPTGASENSSTFNRVLKQARQSFMPLMRNKEPGVEMEAK
jgi:flagellar biosynthetic protein FliO